jgi:hypothetical protein
VKQKRIKYLDVLPATRTIRAEDLTANQFIIRRR